MELVCPSASDEGLVQSLVVLGLLTVAIRIGRKYGRWLTMWALLIGLQVTLRIAAALMSKVARFAGAVVIGAGTLLSVAFYVLLPLQQSPDKLLAAFVTSLAAFVAILLCDPVPEHKVRSYLATLLQRQNIGYLFAVAAYYTSSVALAAEVIAGIEEKVSRNEMEDDTGFLFALVAFLLIVLFVPVLAHHWRRIVSRWRIWTYLEDWARAENPNRLT